MGKTYLIGNIVQRVTTIVSSATPTVNVDLCDDVNITALATAITSMTTGLSGTPDNFQQLTYRIKDDGTARAIAWGASFVAAGAPLPVTTIVGAAITVVFQYDSVQSKWGCVLYMAGSTSGPWLVNGNTVITGDWIGTQNNEPFLVRTNNILKATFKTDGTFDLNSFVDGTHSLAAYLISGNTVLSFGGGGNTDNIAVGSGALSFANENIECSCVGYQSCNANAVITGASALGYKALNSMTGTYSTGVGWQAGLTATGKFLALLGANAGGNLTTGEINLILGTGSGQGITTGSENTIIHGPSFPHAAGLSNTIAIYDGHQTTPRQGFYSDSNGCISVGIASPVQSTVGASTSGNVIFSQPNSATNYKKIVIYLDAALGTASYVFPTAFTQLPGIVATSLVVAGVVTTLTTTGVTITGATDTGFIFLEGY